MMACLLLRSTPGLTHVRAGMRAYAKRVVTLTRLHAHGASQRQVLVVEVPAKQAPDIEMKPDGKWQPPVTDCSRDVHDYGVRVGRVEGTFWHIAVNTLYLYIYIVTKE